MRKKILGVMLAAVLLMAYSVPVFATEGIAEEDILSDTQEIMEIEEDAGVPEEPVEIKDTLTPKAEGEVSEYPEVQAAYDAFIKIEDSLKSGDYASMKAAIDELEAASDVIDNGSDAIQSDWERVADELIGSERLFDVVFDAAFIIAVNEDLPKAFNEDKNAGTAYELIDLYNDMKDIMSESYGVDLDSMLSEETKATIADAKAYYPSENVLAVYEAWETVDDALFGPYPEEFDAAMAEFENKLDIFNAMNESDLEQLAGLLGVDGAEAAFDKILDDWVTINVLNEFVNKYEAYDKNPNKETAQAFVEYYDSIFNDPDWEDYELREMARACFAFDIEAEYNEAKALLNPASKDKDNDRNDEGKSPDTGDNTPVPLLAGIMLLSAATVTVAMRKRA